MNRHKRVRCALALLTMLTAGLLSGCVSDAASDSTLPTITVGSDTYPPYVYMDNNGDITGLDVDIAEEAFRRMGYRAEFTTIDWEQKTKLVDNGEIDCIWDCFSMDGRENDCRGPTEELRGTRGRAHRYRADSGRKALGWVDCPVDCAAIGQRHSRRVRGRFRRGAVRHVSGASRAGIPVRLIVLIFDGDILIIGD